MTGLSPRPARHGDRMEDPGLFIAELQRVGYVQEAILGHVISPPPSLPKHRQTHTRTQSAKVPPCDRAYRVADKVVMRIDFSLHARILAILDGVGRVPLVALKTRTPRP
ncbi:hypothetical protein EVAR_28092_1 [Eumeta japonica]|uniref:Uncharacterized protein n=1 Tax=Eumeta variegata TaxID=151549 RepID=A0A4C1WB15_EUMVA|nr:hypothetical protein EVAR_28092_1 [Eumeta japonica]